MKKDEHRKKVREANKKKYDSNEEYKEYQNTNSKMRNKAMGILKENHKEEYKKILSDLKNEA